MKSPICCKSSYVGLVVLLIMILHKLTASRVEPTGIDRVRFSRRAMAVAHGKIKYCDKILVEIRI